MTCKQRVKSSLSHRQAKETTPSGDFNGLGFICLFVFWFSRFGNLTRGMMETLTLALVRSVKVGRIFPCLIDELMN